MKSRHHNSKRSMETMAEKNVTLNGEVIKRQIRELVPRNAEGLLKAEKLTKAARYERNESVRVSKWSQ